MKNNKGITTFKLLMIIGILLITVVAIIIIMSTRQQINEGDIFNEVTFKDEIPLVKVKSDTYIVIEDSKNNKYYQIMLFSVLGETEPCIVVAVLDNTQKNKTEKKYWYAWEKGANLTGGKLTRGWNIEIGDNTYSPVDSLSIPSISGTVVFTEGDTSIFRKILNY